MIRKERGPRKHTRSGAFQSVERNSIHAYSQLTWAPMLHINVCNIPREHTMSVLSSWLSCSLPDKYNGNGALSQHGAVIWTLGRGENAREGTFESS